MTVKNDNFGGFKFENSSRIINVRVMYENVTTIGDIKIGMRCVGSRDTEHVNVVAVLQVRMRSSGVLLTLADEMLSSDINSGLLRLSSYGKLRGEVRVMKMIRTRATAEMNCSMCLNFTSRAIQDLLCM
ncbi:late embryogenesis abundant protein At1g64065-like [Cornus florida]|uniref:late embryogenesis abundant protein At1g64065-like n=1 Tax=Cornus florida TaxID=4283 RepID=UPI00289B9118|nr:late embryogenesis abundant protein At1g64065-like [Cornus florida]